MEKTVACSRVADRAGVDPSRAVSPPSATDSTPIGLESGFREARPTKGFDSSSTILSVLCFLLLIPFHNGVAMSPGRLHRWPFVLFFFACSQALPQAVTAANIARNETPNNFETAPWAVMSPAPVPPEPLSDDQDSSPAQDPPFGWGIAVYPALAWLPFFGADVSLPPVPSQPTAPGPSGSTSGALNGAYFGGARFERGKWSADALFMWTVPST